ncbi:shikimate dehydrogenase [Megalodesulfovibrio gigas]|uniref:Shikimate dehydrogenase (NADP(+)) n=1 Tax=Megalodesulfovibrio gigas (strain ATCC 19364 / DSM 1382 / NCIMB 9332 / VKM B-1759) TaxID=1121448 RepID=T2G9G7_MEGG1|nr:shikimate dehydrogenase [Megalodesulfovibrio gigas]AGW12766.1 putative shikimate 5-dehydrogenase [Megalodesulfovibrio gigas DSM 1382 = ATCC 19364]
MELQRFPKPLPDSPALLLGIIGQPLGHTLSPVLHNWALQEAGVSGVYCRWELPPEQLGRMLDAVRTLPIHGLSVTIPHKEAVIDLLDEITPFARQVGAVNTIYWQDDRLCGDNTDVEGFLTPLRGLPVFDSALVLGAGGAARAALAGLKALGVTRIGIANRSADRAQALAEVFHVQQIPWEARTDFGAALVVNATPLGMHGARKDQSPWPEDAWTRVTAAYDLVYNPLRTRFLIDARAAGAQALEGLGMFLGQGQCQFTRWTGATFPWDPARLLLLEALRERG